MKVRIGNQRSVLLDRDVERKIPAGVDNVVCKQRVEIVQVLHDPVRRLTRCDARGQDIYQLSSGRSTVVTLRSASVMIQNLNSEPLPVWLVVAGPAAQSAGASPSIARNASRAFDLK